MIGFLVRLIAVHVKDRLKRSIRDDVTPLFLPSYFELLAFPSKGIVIKSCVPVPSVDSTVTSPPTLLILSRMLLSP